VGVRILIGHFRTQDTSYDIPLIKHIINIARGKAFIIKPIDKNDGFLFEVFREIFNRFKNTPFKYHDFRVALDYNTPLFFHYVKLGGVNNWGFERTHSPSLEMILLPQRLEQVKTTVINRIVGANQLDLFLKGKNVQINSEFYVIRDSKRGSKLIKELLDGYIKEKVQESFPEIKKINYSDPPWYFNALLVIEQNTKK
jgi:hypothetical protein